MQSHAAQSRFGLRSAEFLCPKVDAFNFLVSERWHSIAVGRGGEG